MTRTCLLITERLEPAADRLLVELRKRDISCVRWNLDAYPSGSALTYRTGADGFDGEIETDGRTVALGDVGSIWCRGLAPLGVPDDLHGNERAFAETEAQRMLQALATICDAHWINHPDNNRRANSKPAQLFVAQRLGFEIPQTLFTNHPDQARAFFEQLEKSIIYKTLSQSLNLDSGEALFTTVVSEKELSNIELVRACPALFQELVLKSFEIRATVVGDKVFSAKIDSQAHTGTKTDWRRDPLSVEYEAFDLPEEIQKQIREYMLAFGLEYGALDFIVTEEGDYVFLEINPAGQYLWVEAATGLPITGTLAKALENYCRV